MHSLCGRHFLELIIYFFFSKNKKNWQCIWIWMWMSACWGFIRSAFKSDFVATISHFHVCLCTNSTIRMWYGKNKNKNVQEKTRYLFFSLLFRSKNFIVIAWASNSFSLVYLSHSLDFSLCSTCTYTISTNVWFCDHF